MLAVNWQSHALSGAVFDPRDNRPVTLPIVFADMPDLAAQQQAKLLLSRHGLARGRARRGQRFRCCIITCRINAIVFATNDRRPDFLRDHPRLTRRLSR